MSKETIKSEKFTGQQIAKRMFWLAYCACGGPLGMGLLQARKSVTEEDVWKNVFSGGDYTGTNHHRNNEKRAYGDYVFGRMMKLGIEMGPNEVTIPTSAPTHDYQSWCGQYPTYASLAADAILSLAGDDTTQSGGEMTPSGALKAAISVKEMMKPQ